MSESQVLPEAIKGRCKVPDVAQRAQILIRSFKWRNTSLARSIRTTLLAPFPNDASRNMVEDSH